jgi:hypothetical protein
MANRIGRLSAVRSVGLSLGAALSFLAAARWAGEAPWTAIVGGTVWVFLLALIVALPVVTGWVQRRSAGPGADARRHPGDRSAMELTAVAWLCTLPFLLLLLGPWLGFKVVLVVALAWAIVTAAVCWMLCTTHGAWSHNRGGAR